jgi:CheY-like chemotaxis protein
VLLIVERDPHVRELQETFLCDAGFAVEFVDNGLAALERMRELRPRLLITEVLVPGLDGLALCRRIKADPELRAVPVLVLSMLVVAEHVQDAGADGYLRKPIERQRLVRTVQRLLARADDEPTPEVT